MAMHVRINDREIGPLIPGDATIGEMIEAIRVHVDPSEIVTAVEIDGTGFSAGEDERYVRRSAGAVRRLVIATSPPAAFARSKRREVAGALLVIAAKVRLVVELFERGDARGANALVAALMEELRLVLLLDHQLTSLDGTTLTAAGAEIRELAPLMLAAQERGSWPELVGVFQQRLIPLLASWSVEEDRAGESPGA
jgi:hypothetical protein